MPSPFAIHADGDFGLQQDLRKVVIGELGTLINPDNFRPAIAGKRLIESIVIITGQPALRLNGEQRVLLEARSPTGCFHHAAFLVGVLLPARPAGLSVDARW